MTEWREVVLGELCERVTVGHVGKMADRYVEDGIPFLRSQNIKPFRVDTEGVLRIGPDFHAKLSKSELRHGDVAIVRTGYPGTAAVVPRELDGCNCADLVIITPGEGLNPHMLAAVMNSTWGQSAVGGHLVGAAQQHFNVGSAKALRLRLPDRGAQDRIAEILCALNDLIENNRRRVEVLEEIARAIYREWFVHFRFPGHEDVTFVDSDLGPIPEGWVMESLGAIATTHRQTIQPKREPDTTFSHYSIPAFDDGRLPVKERGEAIRSAKFVVDSAAVMVSKLNPRIPRTWFVEPVPGSRSVASTEFVILRPSVGRTLEWIYLTATSPAFEERLKQLSGGTSGSHQRLRPDEMLAVPVLDPGRGLVARASDTVRPGLELARRLELLTDRLATARDLLLPKLVTGQIDVSELDLGSVVERVAS